MSSPKSPSALVAFKCVILAGAMAPLCAGARSSINITGQWTGTMDVTSEFGELKHYTEMVALDQNGKTVSGTFELTAARKSPVLHGTVHGATVTFAIALDGRLQMFFHLGLASNRLVGYGTCTTDLGRVRAQVTLTRVTKT